MSNMILAFCAGQISPFSPEMNRIGRLPSCEIGTSPFVSSRLSRCLCEGNIGIAAAEGTCKQTAADINNASPAPLLTNFGDPRIFRHAIKKGPNHWSDPVSPSGAPQFARTSRLSRSLRLFLRRRRGMLCRSRVLICRRFARVSRSCFRRHLVLWRSIVWMRSLRRRRRRVGGGCVWMTRR